MYIVKDSSGNIEVIATRKEDAEAMTQTIGREPTKTIETKKSTA